MRAKSAIVIIIVLVFSVFGFTAQAAAPVTLLDIGAGVRPMGMGGAFVALADDENTVFYNPAGLAYFNRLKLGAFYEPRFGASFGDLAIAGQYLGGGLIFFNLGGIPQYDERDRQGETFSYGSSAFFIAGGATLKTFLAQLPESVALGLSLKSYQVNVLNSTGSGLALDLGLLWHQGLRFGAQLVGLRLGAVAENLLSLGINYKGGYTEPWAVGLRLGGALLISDAVLALDFESRGIFRFGGEYRYSLQQFGVDELAIRLGGFLHGGLAFTLGLGLRYQNFRIDYAFIAYSQAPATHRLSFTMQLKLPRLF